MLGVILSKVNSQWCYMNPLGLCYYGRRCIFECGRSSQIFDGHVEMFASLYSCEISALRRINELRTIVLRPVEQKS